MIPKFSKIIGIISSYQFLGEQRNTIDGNFLRKSSHLLNYYNDGYLSNSSSSIGRDWSNFTNSMFSFYESIDQNDDKNESPNDKFKQWWEEKTKGRSGLAIYAIPFLVTKLSVFTRMSPLLLKLCSQYIEPINVVAYYSLHSPRLLSFAKKVTAGYFVVSVVYMLWDLYSGGSIFVPFKVKDDSYALITGSTSVLGQELASLYFQHGFNLILVSSQNKQLQNMKNSLISSDQSSSVDPEQQRQSRHTNGKYGPERSIIDMHYDLRHPTNVFKLLKDIQRRNLKVDVLVNNAEHCYHGSLHEFPWMSMRSIIDTNIQSTVMLTRMLIPSMIYRFKSEKRQSRVVFISSSTAVASAADLGLYSATKSFLSIFSKSLRRECMSQGVAVTCAYPDIVPDAYYLDSQTLKQSSLGLRVIGFATNAKEVAREIYYGSINGRNSVAPGMINKLYLHLVSKVVPEPLLATFTSVCWSPMPRFFAKFKSKSARRLEPNSTSALISYICDNEHSRLESQVRMLNSVYTDDRMADTEMDLTSNHISSPFSRIVFCSSEFRSGEDRFKDWLRNRWEEPLIDYHRFQKWFQHIKSIISNVTKFPPEMQNPQKLRQDLSHFETQSGNQTLVPDTSNKEENFKNEKSQSKRQCQEGAELDHNNPFPENGNYNCKDDYLPELSSESATSNGDNNESETSRLEAENEKYEAHISQSDYTRYRYETHNQRSKKFSSSRQYTNGDRHIIEDTPSPDTLPTKEDDEKDGSAQEEYPSLEGRDGDGGGRSDDNEHVKHQNDMSGNGDPSSQHRHEDMEGEYTTSELD